MNKIFLCFAICFVFGCNNKREAKTTVIYSICNNSSKTIAFLVDSDIGEKYIIVEKRLSNKVIFEKTEKIIDNGGWTIYGGDGDARHSMITILINNECLYSLTDTSSICYKNENNQDSIHDSHCFRSEEIFISGTAWDATCEYAISVSDTLIDCLKKDYTMLEKFKDYYKK